VKAGAQNDALQYEEGIAAALLSSKTHDDEAAAHYRTALKMLTTLPGLEPWQAAFPLAALGELEWRKKHWEKAARELTRADALFETHPADIFVVARVKMLLAESLWESGGDRKRARMIALAGLKILGDKKKLTTEGPRLETWLETHRP
jgi:hypothetical protein